MRNKKTLPPSWPVIKAGQYGSSVFLLLLTFLCVGVTSSATSAASLYGTVTEVNDGHTITIVCLKRPLKVGLMAIDAPDSNQAFGDIARQHLSDLTIGKFVAVEYTGLGQNALIIARVTWKDMDVGAQMIRDGVAWYDKNNNSSLSEDERQIYAQSEIAARSEKRGLWQDPAPLAPWEFRTLAVSLRNASSGVPAVQSTLNLGSQRSFSSLDLVLAGPQLRSSHTSQGREGWTMLTPTGEHFSVLAPAGGFQTSSENLVGPEGSANFHHYISNIDGASYLVMWTRGPNYKYTDVSASDETVAGMIEGINEALERQGLNRGFKFKNQRDLSLSGYSGKEYNLSGAVSGILRVYTKRVGNDREIYAIGVLAGAETDPQVDQFLNSFKLQGN